MDTLAILFLAALGYGVFWFLLFHSLARLSGWHALGLRYSTSVRPEGRSFGWGYSRFGWLDYNGCQTFVVAPEGLYIALWRLFAAGHPPLLIPWPSLRVVVECRGRFYKMTVLDVDDPPLLRIRIPFKVFDAARPYLAAQPAR
jgi:hypothetical protein